MCRLRLWVLLFSFVLALLAGCNDFGKVMKSKDFDYKLSRADGYFEKKKYRYAQQLYEELFPVFKGTQKFEDLYYKYAYCFYNQGLYREAENLFKGYLEVFPNSLKAEEIDFKRAYCFYKQSPKLELEQVNTLRTMGMMQTFINTHPASAHNIEASEIIDKCRHKLEQKDFRSAKLFYDMGSFRAAALAFNTLLNDYPESQKADEYKLFVVRAYFKFAELSIPDKQLERFEKVISEFSDFADRFPESKFLDEAREFNESSINKIKVIQNEQVSPSVKR
jgi:outer membrane protein assembly factor BamD